MHRFPYTDKLVYDEWITRVKNPKLKAMPPSNVYKSYRVCNVHFNDVCIIDPKMYHHKSGLKERSLPSINIPGFKINSTIENSFLPLESYQKLLEDGGTSSPCITPHTDAVPKFQYSEGQRKALFEECVAERNQHTEEISRLKKETSELVNNLKDDKCLSAKNRIHCTQLQALGHIGDKTCMEVKETLNLEIIEKSKQLDLLKYRTRKKEEYLKKIADDYQTLISGKLEKHIKRKIEKPITKIVRELQNNIHAVQVQWREADHVRIRYREIKDSLLEDAAHFESNIGQTKIQLQKQQFDIEHLKEINLKASKLRTTARSILLKEERGAMKSAATRERQSIEGKRLIMERKQELEKLEKKIFQTGKTSVRPEIDGDESNVQTPTSPLCPHEECNLTFETLRNATGGNTIDEILERFVIQKETTARLSQLRKSGEEQKIKLEQIFDNSTAQLESLKFVEVKEAEESAEELEALKIRIENEQQNIQNCIATTEKNADVITLVFEHIQQIYFGINPLVDTEKHPLKVVEDLCSELKHIMREFEKLEEDKKNTAITSGNVEERNYLPHSYSNLLGRMLPPQGPSITPEKVSDEEEEVPSRSYLKRQAQIVVDAKSRRKSLRFPSKK